MNQDGIGWLLTRVVSSALTLGDVKGLVNRRAAGNEQVHPEPLAAGIGDADGFSSGAGVVRASVPPRQQSGFFKSPHHSQRTRLVGAEDAVELPAVPRHQIL